MMLGQQRSSGVPLRGFQWLHCVRHAFGVVQMGEGKQSQQTSPCPAASRGAIRWRRRRLARSAIMRHATFDLIW